jgi:uncharacterized cupredoxin-like copper-binding protein
MRRVLLVATVVCAILFAGCTSDSESNGNLTGSGSGNGSGSGSGATNTRAPDREATVSSADYSFEVPADLAIKSGEAIKITLTNVGKLRHELEVFTPAGDALGEIEPIKAGEKGEGVFTFAKPGIYTFVCGVDDHKARGMTADVKVS